jgi:tRNA threonylcarbamoyladenosine biosynthesis protein TsaE
MQIHCLSLQELPKVAEQVVDFAGNQKIWIFEGGMGAGKTTLIKTICHILGVKDTVSSPTFSIVNEYATAEDTTIYHFDFYRIRNEAEAIDIGIDEYLYSGELCLIEWPSKIENLLPEDYLKIDIQITSDTERTISLSHHERNV